MTDIGDGQPNDWTSGVRIPAGADQFGERRGLGVSTIYFKAARADPSGLLALENVLHAKDRPARHLHYAQDE
jgi:hypothetical protein